jgi:hypothetical protein
VPIKPENRHHYRTPEWKAAAKAVRDRSGSKCECNGECGLDHIGPGGRCCAPNGATIMRDWRRNVWELHMGCSGCLEPLLDGKITCGAVRVVLTVAHLDHDAGTNNPDRMKHLCQLCHNRYDSPHRQANAAATRRAKEAALNAENGQADLPLGGSR